MRSFSVRIASVAMALSFTLQLSAQNASNPIQVALLRWYQANTAAVLTVHNTCIGPQGMVFDGAHLWVSCVGSNELDEYDPYDLTFLQKVSLTSPPFFLLYDGGNIWATNPTGAGTVTEVQASTGTVLRIIPVGFASGSNPSGMVFDGLDIWVANYSDDSVSKIQVETGAVTNISLAASCTDPRSLAYDGVHSAIWVACNGAPNGPFVVELNSSGTVVATTASIGNTPNCNNMAFDGTNIWVTTSSGSTFASVTEINTSTLALTVISLPANSGPAAVAYDGDYIWVARGDGHVSKIVASTATLAGSAPATGGTAYTLAFDGGNMWVSTPNVQPNGAYIISKM